MDVYERAQRYVAKMPAAISGQGGHNATFAVAIALVRGFSLGDADAKAILEEFNKRCEPEWSAAELKHKLENARTFPIDKADGYLLGEDSAPTTTYTPREVVAPAEKLTFENEKLKTFGARWRPHISTAWLADRSAINPFRVTSAEFLDKLYDRTCEFVLVFTNNKSQGEAVWPLDELPQTGPEGVWFLIQPVDGKVYPNPRNLKDGKPKLSRRSEESVTSWRYLVLESDKADPRDWLGALVRLQLAIAAIYTSGRRSVHALIRLDAPSLPEWRDFSNSVMKPILTRLGADAQVLATSVRLSRLPGCDRAGRMQKLLYLNPNPAVKPICTIPPQRDTLKTLAAIAEKYSPDAAKWIREANAQNLDECITALAKREEFHNSVNVSLDDLLFALEWFSTSAAARELLSKLRAKGNTNEFNQRNETQTGKSGEGSGTT